MAITTGLNRFSDALASRRDRRSEPAGMPLHLPDPPGDDEVYSYFGGHRRWPFVWLFIGQALVIYGFVMVMKKSPDTLLGLVFLTVMVPPVLVNLWLRVRRPRTTVEAHWELVDSFMVDARVSPTVDVFLPSCGEDIRVLTNTFEHVSQLEWSGGVVVHVLDDADSREVVLLAAEYGFQYQVRPNLGEWKKAGNLIHGFDHSSSEFCVVFDADFAPRSDFLQQTIPYFNDPRVGVVQTAQYFDVDAPGINYMARYAGALQELFFRWIQPARDTYEAAICAGTNVVYRRAAVEAAGGFAKVPLGEDVHSGVKIWVAHYRTRYVPLVLAKGLAPDSWAGLTNQQYRWCRSSMLLMVSRFFKDAPFSRAQRICYWAAFLYYMASAAVLVTGPLPTLLMLWKFPDQIRWWYYLLVLPAFTATFFVFPRLARGWSFRMYRVSAINSVCHLLAVVDALRQQVQAWVPTGAATQPSGVTKANIPRRVAIVLRTWLITVQGLLWFGLWHALPVVGALPLLPLIGLGLVQAYMLVPLLVRLDPASGRTVVGSGTGALDLPSETRIGEVA